MTTGSSSQRIYLDNAATSFPKPEAVYEAVDRYNRQVGVAVGRSAYRQAIELHRVIDRCRVLAAQILGAEGPERIIFTFNATDGLNLAIHGLLRPGDHVVTSVVEHNSVLRPLRDEEERNGVRVSRVAADGSGWVDPDAVRKAIGPDTRLVALLHASNVTGTIQPIREVAEIAHEAGALVLVDAAQTAGHLPIDLRTLPADVLACAGHKGLLGPLGTGLLYVRPGVEDQLRSLRQGGTGSRSEEDRQPAHLPDKYESGNHNAPALCGLAAALEFLIDQRVDAIEVHESRLTRRLLEGLAAIPGVQVYGPGPDRPRVGVVSFTLDGFEPQDLATILDESFGIQARAGLHCAPGAHRAIGTFDRGGTVRFSTSLFTTEADIDAALTAVGRIACPS